MTENADRPPLLGMNAALSRGLHLFAITWALLAIAGLALAAEFDLFDYQPGRAAIKIAEQPIFMLLFALGVLMSLKWEIVGGTIAAFTAAALVVFATQQLEPWSAIAVFVAFAIPALLWIVIDVNDQRPPIAALGLVVAIVAIVSGALIAATIYDRIFGPTHPGSDTKQLTDSELDWVWSGSVTESAFSVTAKVSDDDADSVRLIVGRTADLADGRPLGSSVAPDDDGLVRLEAADLLPDTSYHYAIEVDGVVDLVRAGAARTLPTGPSSFAVAVGGDARVGSNGKVFDAIRAVDPLLYLIVGDIHYGDIGEDDADLFEEVLDLTLTRPAQAALYRSTPVGYMWDDHDFGGNGSDSTSESASTAMGIFRRYVPHYPLAGPKTPVYQAFTIGRVRFILSDGRSGRTPASAPDNADKSMLGSEQKVWLKQELLASNDTHPLIVWVNALPWISEPSAGSDDWGGYATERRELADFIASNDIDGLLMISGDAHMLAIDDGTNSNYSTTGASGFPIMHAAALDRPGSVKGGPYTEGAVPGGGQFGVLTVTDDGGDTISVSLSGRNWENEELIAYDFEVTESR